MMIILQGKRERERERERESMGGQIQRFSEREDMGFLYKNFIFFDTYIHLFI